MSFSNVHWVAVVISAIIAIVSGSIWFGPRTFYPVWWRAMGHSKDEIPGAGMNMGLVFGATFASQFVQASALAFVLSAVGNLNALNGLISGILIGIGIAGAAALPHKLFAGHGFKVWLIEVGN